MGYAVEGVENGRVHFVGDAAAVPRANLWLRCADRLLWDIGRFEARTFDELFEGTRALPWERVIPADGCFPAAKITSVKSQLFSKADGQRIVKKAVAKRLGACYRLDWLPEDGAVYPIHIRILKDAVTLSLDTSGSGLNKRGYRAHAGGAPLKETLVAFQKLPFQQVRTKRRYGVIVTNPPYGERLSDTAGVKRLYREMGAAFAGLPDWSYFILTAYPDFEAAFGRRATKNRKLYNSMLKTYCYQYFGPLPPRRGRREAIAGGTGGTSGGKRHETKA